MVRADKRRRRGATLLELVIASSMLAVMVTATALALRTGHAAWSAHADDAAELSSALATVRHVVRQVRQAQAVTAISAATDTAGTISVLMPSGNTYVWARNGGTDEVSFGEDTADSLLAEGITSLKFTGYEADAQTATTVVEDVRAVRCEAQVVLPRGGGDTQAVSCWAWLRAWQ